ncbi:MAG: excinuclease ABC subunit UvrA [Candidatus Bathyarchaeota archaeon]|nr:MAG: excinuclease ABC subunit UvrA [Candidatus Bathyarchaeota archaeon]
MESETVKPRTPINTFDEPQSIIVIGASEHNLQHINVEIPKSKLTVVTGVSGSGKSSLVYDTIYAEGQRRFVESLSAYARRFLGMLEKPKVDYITGLSPSISIDQKSVGRNPRSTVGTITDIYSYLRLLYARVGTPHCPKCHREVQPQTPQQIVDHILTRGADEQIQILAPLVRGRKGTYQRQFRSWLQKGFIQARVDGEFRSIEEDIALDRHKEHSIDLVVDRLSIAEHDRARIAEAVETALAMSNGFVTVLTPRDDLTFSEKLACPQCGFSLPELEPRIFSWNDPHGACPHCKGLGYVQDFDVALVIPDPTHTVDQIFGRTYSWMLRRKSFQKWADRYGFTKENRWQDLSKRQQHLLLRGSGDEKITYLWEWKPQTRSARSNDVEVGGIAHRPFEGLIQRMQRQYRQTTSDYIRRELEQYMRRTTCPVCQGKRLRAEAEAVTFAGYSITDLDVMPIAKLKQFFRELEVQGPQKIIAEKITREIKSRLDFLCDVGLDYLTLSRSAPTLAGGEAQRIRLASQIGSELVGVTYVCDEPSIGLHARDNRRLLNSLKRLRDLGNTVIIVEHDEATMRAADYLVDLGPGAGTQGGRIVAEGPPDAVQKAEGSITARYLRKEETIAAPIQRRRSQGQWITIKGARHNNLKNIDVRIPLGLFVAITGVSGSGKSSLIVDTLQQTLFRRFYRSHRGHVKTEDAGELILVSPGDHDEILGVEYLDKAIVIDQSPIGRTPRSNPSTYTGLWTPLRELFAGLPESQIRGYKPGRFSFNVKGGRCARCKGAGVEVVEMHFLPPVHVTCSVCKGRRYNQETLQIRYKGKNIADILSMTIAEGLEFFHDIPALHRRLKTLNEVGMGYVKLGQPATSLSGGEAQRIKLSKYLSRSTTGQTLIILDEPTTGLHFHDIKRLLEVLHQLVDRGNTVVIIEHQLDVVKTADWIIDLGPEGGDDGGYLVAEGTPEDIANCAESYTGQYLKEMLGINGGKRH